MTTFRKRFTAASAAGDAKAMDSIAREVAARVKALAPITHGVVLDPKIVALLLGEDDDQSDEALIEAAKKLAEFNHLAETIEMEPVDRAEAIVRVAQHDVDAVAQEIDVRLSKVANELGADYMESHVREDANKGYDTLLCERHVAIHAQRVRAVEGVLAEREKVLVEREAIKVKLIDGRDDPLVKVKADDQASAAVAERLDRIESHLQAATFLVPTPANAFTYLKGDSTRQQHRLGDVWAEEGFAKHTGTDWRLFAESTPAVQWIVPFEIPRGAVTIISGDGGVGKSRLAIQLATANSLSEGLWITDWVPTIKDSTAKPIVVNRTRRPSLTMIVNAEDQSSEMARRIVQIRAGIAKAKGGGKPEQHMGNELALGMGRIQFYQARGHLWGPAESGSTHIETAAELTDVGKDVRAQCEQMGVKLLILDPLANLYGSSENTRTHVAAYMRSWNAWAQRTGIAVVMLAHPPKSGAGFSGSTSWVGAARSAIEFKRVWVLINGEGQLEDADKVQKDRKATEKATNTQQEAEKPVPLYRLSVTKTNYAYTEQHWLAESGMAFITGEDAELYQWAKNNHVAQESNRSATDGNGTSLADMKFMK